MSSKLIGRVIETTVIHLTAGAASQAVEQGWKKGVEWYKNRKKDTKKTDPEIKELTAPEAMSQMKRGL